MRHVGIVDYGMSNLDSLARAVQECGARTTIAEDPRELNQASQILLPGVGVFAQAMKNLRDRGFEQTLSELVLGKNVPMLGICLGMQLLASKGYEGGTTPGLGFIEGEVKKLEPSAADIRIPHVGWNALDLTRPTRLLAQVTQGTYVYFTHSYAAPVTDDTAATTSYGNVFAAAVERDHVFGVQFHPEKSSDPGLQMIRNFLARCRQQPVAHTS